jgi:hypothetical protein
VPAAPPDLDADLTREARRLFRRYAVEVVEALGFCPWAEAARKRGEVREDVRVEATLDPARDAAWVREIAAASRIVVGVLLFPRASLTESDWHEYVRGVREAYAKAPGPHGTEMAMVGFHPDAEGRLDAPQTIVNFTRRCPDPTIQAIRLRTLETMRQKEGGGTQFFDPRTSDLATLLAAPPARPLHERVAEANVDTVRRLGVEEIVKRMDDIRRDRDATYRALGL